jgi:hypothetical protein
MDERDFSEIFEAGESMRELLNGPLPHEVTKPRKPQYYHRDGKPIYSTELMPDFMQWAMLFETEERCIAETKTIYGERLSTIFLGMDHSFNSHPDAPPILFETMLFAPRSIEMRQALRERLRRASSAVMNGAWDKMEWEETKAERRIAKNYPHDQLQIRYVTEREALDKHEELTLQCLIPPRWRRFLLYTIGEDATWE